jgi:SAM-dependent methyltransferase
MARAKASMKVALARLMLFVSKAADAPLSVTTLDTLYPAYCGPPEVRYDEEGLMLRADDNITRMGECVDLSGVESALEIGCWDGMVSSRLARLGVRCCALDISREGFDPRAKEAGVRFVQSDACRMPFSEGALDLIFSFAAFEHFPDPSKVLAESARVLRPGGKLFLDFGPIATAPYGLHAYRSIPVPYVHILFDKKDLTEYAQRRGLPTNWPYINGVTLNQYRQIFEDAKRDFDTVAYKEHGSGGIGAELIVRYPGVFQRASRQADDFFVSVISICLERRAAVTPSK